MSESLKGVIQCSMIDRWYLFLTRSVAFKLGPDLLSWILNGKIQEVKEI